MRALVLLLVIGGSHAGAETPLPFGLRVQDVETLESHDSNAVFSKGSLAAADAAEQAMLKAEQGLGPYHPELAPMLVRPANLALATGDDESATRFSR